MTYGCANRGYHGGTGKDADESDANLHGSKEAGDVVEKRKGEKSTLAAFIRKFLKAAAARGNISDLHGREERVQTNENDRGYYGDVGGISRD